MIGQPVSLSSVHTARDVETMEPEEIRLFYLHLFEALNDNENIKLKKMDVAF